MTFDEHVVNVNILRHFVFAGIHNQRASSREFAAFSQVFLMFYFGKCDRILPALLGIRLRDGFSKKLCMDVGVPSTPAPQTPFRRYSL
jgi:hypothetical protein